MATYRITAPDGGSYEVTAPDTATEAEVMAYAQQNYKPAAKAPEKSGFLQGAKDLAAGAVRGAGSIGATILAPVDAAARAFGVQNDFIGRDDRREQMDAGLANPSLPVLGGADPASLLFKTGKLGGEIAGTAGAGGVLANGARALGGTRAMAGLEPIVNGVARGLETGGFRVGDLAGTGMGTLARLGTGGAVGGLSAGMVNPEDAGTGALIGGALPGGAQLAGNVGEVLGGFLRKGAKPNNVMLDTARRSMDAGYTIPPSMIDPTFRNRTLESLSGKFETAQLASTKNQQVTDDLVRKALSLPKDAPLTQDTMRAVRQQAGSVYQQLKGTGTVLADQAYIKALDDVAKQIKSATAAFPQLGKTNMHGQPIDEIGQLVGALKQPQFDAGGAVDAISVLRDKADTAFSSGDKQLGRASKAAAAALEDVLDRHLQQIGANDLLPAYRDARSLIAKTYTVEKGLREGSGIVDARAIGRELQKGKPLSGELLNIGQFGNTFNKAAQPPQLIGSPAVNVLKPALSLLTGAAGGAAMGPGGIALGAVNYLAPPVARSLMFSRPFQRGLLETSAPFLDEASQLGLLSRGALTAPVLSAQ